MLALSFSPSAQRSALRGVAWTTLFTSVAALSLAAAPSIALAQPSADAAAAPEAPPDDVQLCARAFEQAQRARNETHYLAANQEALKCANPKCGEALFQECTKLYTDLQEAIPSVVFSARDPNNTEIFDVRVSIDGKPLVEQLDGKPVPIDPGNHTFVFTAANGEIVDHTIVVRAGEKFRQVSVMIGQPLPTAVQPTTPATPPPLVATESSKPRSIPVMSYVLGGVGVVGVAGFVALRAMGGSDYDKLEDDCSPNCTDDQVDPVRQKYLLSYGALGVGAAGLIGAAIIYFAQPTGSSTATTGSTTLLVAPTRNGAVAGLSGRF